MKWRLGIWVCLLAATAWAEAPRLQPPAGPDVFPAPTYGDAENVALLADLLNDVDPLVREQAARDLGETHNPLALPHVQAATKDEDINVRLAALQAMAQLDAGRYAAATIEALQSREARLLLAALEAVRRDRIASAVPAVRTLAAPGEVDVAAEALATLSELNVAAEPAALKGLLASPSAAVRLRAAENAALLDRAGDLRDDVLRLAESDASPAVRGAALAAAGKGDFLAAATIVGQAQRDADPLVRRGALRACQNAAKAERIRAFLDDPSPMVRLAAIQAAGQLRCTDCTARLLELLWTAPDDLSHLAARESLDRIADAQVLPAAAAVVTEAAGKIDQAPVARNLRSACWLLGRRKSKAAFTKQLELLALASLPVDSPILIELAQSLGDIGDAEALPALLRRMDACAKAGVRYLTAKQAANPPPVFPPYSEEVLAAVIEAVGRLKSPSSAAAVLSVAKTRVKEGRFYAPAAAAMRVLPGLIDDANRADVESGIVDVLSEPGYDSPLEQGGMVSNARVEAARAAVRLRLQAAVPALRKMTVAAPLPVAQAAAWALAELTGQAAPPIQPEVRQGEWILRKIR